MSSNWDTLCIAQTLACTVAAEDIDAVNPRAVIDKVI